MSSIADDAVCVSAPGKVLMAGGYLVLERKYEGLVLATSSRFYCVASSSRATTTTTPSNDEFALITISAAQFPAECSWSYRVSLSQTGGSGLQLDLEQTNSEVGRNKFVEITLAKVLQLALESIIEDVGEADAAAKELLGRIRGRGGAGMQAFVMADNDFYSQRERVSD